VNIYELGLIYTIDILDDGKVKVEMTLTAPACPSAQELPEQVKEASWECPALSIVRSKRLGSAWDPSRMTEEAVYNQYVLSEQAVMSTTTTALASPAPCRR